MLGWFSCDITMISLRSSSVFKELTQDHRIKPQKRDESEQDEEEKRKEAARSPMSILTETLTLTKSTMSTETTPATQSNKRPNHQMPPPHHAQTWASTCRTAPRRQHVRRKGRGSEGRREGATREQRGTDSQ